MVARPGGTMEEARYLLTCNKNKVNRYTHTRKPKKNLASNVQITTTSYKYGGMAR